MSRTLPRLTSWSPVQVGLSDRLGRLHGASSSAMARHGAFRSAGIPAGVPWASSPRDGCPGGRMLPAHRLEGGATFAIRPGYPRGRPVLSSGRSSSSDGSSAHLGRRLLHSSCSGRRLLLEGPRLPRARLCTLLSSSSSSSRRIGVTPLTRSPSSQVIRRTPWVLRPMMLTEATGMRTIMPRSVTSSSSSRLGDLAHGDDLAVALGRADGDDALAAAVLAGELRQLGALAVAVLADDQQGGCPRGRAPCRRRGPCPSAGCRARRRRCGPWGARPPRGSGWPARPPCPGRRPARRRSCARR